MIKLSTARLTLHPLSSGHAAQLISGLTDPELYRFIDEEPPASLEALTNRYQTLERGVSPDGTQHWLNWAVQDRESGQYVGYVQATVPASGCAVIGYVIFRSCWGLGFGREAVARLCRYLFEHIGCWAVDAFVDSRNIRSLRIMEHLGFAGVDDGGDAEPGELHFRRTAGAIIPQG